MKMNVNDQRTKILLFLIITLSFIQLLIKIQLYILAISLFIAYFIKSKGKMIFAYGIIVVIYGFKFIKTYKVGIFAENTKSIQIDRQPENNNCNNLGVNLETKIKPEYKNLNYKPRIVKKFNLNNDEQKKSHVKSVDGKSIIINNDTNTENKNEQPKVDNICENLNEINDVKTPININNSGIKIHQSDTDNFRFIFISEFYFKINLKQHMINLFDSEHEITKSDLNNILSDYFHTLDNSIENFITVENENSLINFMVGQGYILRDIILKYQEKGFKFGDLHNFSVMKFNKRSIKNRPYNPEIDKTLNHFKKENMDLFCIIFVKEEYAQKNNYRSF